MVTVAGTVASVVSLEVKLTVNASVVSVLRVMVAVAVPVSAIILRSISTVKLGLSSSMISKVVVTALLLIAILVSSYRGVAVIAIV